MIIWQVFYKDDLNWMKGIGCYVWDTPEILRAKKSYELQSDVSNSIFSSNFFLTFNYKIVPQNSVLHFFFHCPIA